MQELLVRTLRAVVLCATCFATVASAMDPTFDSQSDGSDGPLTVTANTTIDLRRAATGSWQDASPVAGRGIYDPSIWAVVFKYESVSITAGTVSFINHASGAPVVWLVEGDVNIAAGATVSILGQSVITSSNYSMPGPGGFPGGQGGTANAGFGPGGSIRASGNYAPGAGHAVAGGTSGSNPGGSAYGSLDLIPLMGGSGGGSIGSRSGGAGGGAILIASSSLIRVEGIIDARGGSGGSTSTGGASSGGGSGGAIRLVAPLVEVIGTARLTVVAIGGGNFVTNGAAGRVRIEGHTLLIDALGPSPNSFPYYTTAEPGPLFQDDLTPTVRVLSINGNLVTSDPKAGVQSVDYTVKSVSRTIDLVIEARNVAPGKVIQVRVQQATGNPITVNSTPLEGSIVYSTATAQLTLGNAIPGDIVLRVLP